MGWEDTSTRYIGSVGGLERGLGNYVGVVSSGEGVPILSILEEGVLCGPRRVSKGFNTPLSFSLFALLEVNSLGGDRGFGGVSTGDDVEGIGGKVLEKRGVNTSRDSLRSEHHLKGQKGAEARITSSTKPIRCARDRTCFERLVFGVDIDMERVVDFSEMAVVGQVRGKKLGMDFLKEWITKNWLKDIAKMPLIRLLTRGWFSFIFSSIEYFKWVLLKVWSMEDTPIILKRWTPTFDAKKERIDEEPI